MGLNEKIDELKGRLEAYSAELLALIGKEDVWDVRDKDPFGGIDIPNVNIPKKAPSSKRGVTSAPGVVIKQGEPAFKIDTYTKKKVILTTEIDASLLPDINENEGWKAGHKKIVVECLHQEIPSGAIVYKVHHDLYEDWAKDQLYLVSHVMYYIIKG